MKTKAESLFEEMCRNAREAMKQLSKGLLPTDVAIGSVICDDDLPLLYFHDARKTLMISEEEMKFVAYKDDLGFDVLEKEE